MRCMSDDHTHVQEFFGARAEAIAQEFEDARGAEREECADP